MSQATLRELEEAGIARVSLGPALMWASLTVMRNIAVQLQNYGSSWGNNGPNLVNLTLTFRDPAGKNVKPQRLVFQSWTTTQALAPFEFKDVPLP